MTIRILVSALCFIANANLDSAASRQRPNIIFMVADNLGREQVGYYGGQGGFNTPRMDKLASEGVVFDNCLIATPLCSPARCGWNTGRHPYRVGINTQTTPNSPDSGLALEEITIAEVLKSAGYHTALFGKWNLGYDKKFNPIYQGFDEFYGSLAGHADYYTHIYNKSGESHFYRGVTPVQDEGYFDRLFTDQAIRYLRSRQGSSEPFYMNLCFYAPHGPYQPPPGYPQGKGEEDNYRYMIEYLDFCVGRVVDEVDRLDMAENTLIVFMSDQGGSHTNDYGRTLSENSLKVVCNARWKGSIPAGARVRTPWVHYDLYSTFASLGGGKIPDDRVVDGKNVWPLFEGNEIERNRTFYWKFGKEGAVRIGDLKVHMTDGKADAFFDLGRDANEKENLLSRYSEKARQMESMFGKWEDECKAHQTSVGKPD